MSHMQVGWVAAVVCALIASIGAREFFVGVPRFFSALALYALALVMLLPYYSDLIKSPLLPGFGSFLLVHAGGLVRAEARLRQSKGDSVGVDNLSQLALLMLLPLAVPSVPFNIPVLTSEQAQLIAGTVLGAVGYLALLFGVKPLAEEVPIAYRAMLVIIVVYTALELGLFVLNFGATDVTMPTPMVYSFAAAKIVLTAVFSYILIRTTDPQLSLKNMLLRYIGLRPTD